MRIGTLTCHNANNYGAVLQAYALQTVLEQLGHTSRIVDYVPHGRHVDSIFAAWSSLQNVVLNVGAMLRCSQLKRRNMRMSSFRRTHLNTSATTYLNTSELGGSLSDYDAFVCGSDQVWQPTVDHDRAKAFFLGFAEQCQARKISYAPSFGVSCITKSFEDEVSPWIRDIAYLSVREETGRAIVEKATGRQAEVVLDPTLLLTAEQWGKVSTRVPIESPYVLVYSTSQRGLFGDLVKHIKRVTGLLVVVIAPYSMNLISSADRVMYDVGPEEFIGLFASAACVCTNSFHGTAFSLIHRRPFWSVPHNVANSRIADLLQRIDLSDRQVRGVDEFPKAPLEIDYTRAAMLLERERERSLSFLKTALS